MVNTTQILEALETYTGDSESLNRFVNITSSELGPQWTEIVYDVLPNLPKSLKEKLDHAFNYYGATASWNEVHEYLAQTNPLNTQEILERIPTLEYWLNFFGEPGLAVIKQLQEKINKQGISEQSMNQISKEEESENLHELKSDFYEQNIDEPNQGAFQEEVASNTYISDIEETSYRTSETEIHTKQFLPTDTKSDTNELDLPPMDNCDSSSEENLQEKEEITTKDSTYQADTFKNTINKEDILVLEPDKTLPLKSIQNKETFHQDDSFEKNNWKNPVYIQQKTDTNEQFMAKKTFRQLDFVNAVHSWMNARCFSLGNIEIYTYKYYGFLVDTMEQAKADIQEVLSNPAYYPAVEATREGGLKILQNSLLSLEKDLKTAYDNAQTDITPLISENVNTNILKNTLGEIDVTNKKEYLGPAPDGFEIIDEPHTKPISQLTEIENGTKFENMNAQTKNTSQKAQNSIQRKISFSFNKKKPSGTV